MAAVLGTAVANDISSAVLKHFVRGKVLAQTMQERPLLRCLLSGKKTFPGGNQYISDPVQGFYMSDGNAVLAGSNGNAFFQGYKEDDQLQFGQAGSVQRAEYKWYEVHAGLVITWTELKKDGVHITDDGKKSESTDMALTRLTSLLENRLDDFAESWARMFNLMLWRDGTQDPNQIPGLTSLLLENPAVGLTGTLDRATNPWWRNRVYLNIVPSENNQTLTKILRQEQRPLRRFGGKPSKFLAGSAFINALESEVQAKGIYTQEGFNNEGKTDIGLADISLRGVGKFEYDPTMDDLGMGKYCFELDTRKLKLRPMEGEDNKLINPARPYQYMVFLKSMTWTGALQSLQLNCHEIFSIQ